MRRSFHPRPCSEDDGQAPARGRARRPLAHGRTGAVFAGTSIRWYQAPCSIRKNGWGAKSGFLGPINAPRWRHLEVSFDSGLTWITRESEYVCCCGRHTQEV
jgi:hypothetical protein